MRKKNPVSAEQKIRELYRKYSGNSPEEIRLMPVSGSSRKYFRITAQGHSVIGSFNPDIREHKTFVAFTRAFDAAGFPVPEILEDEPDIGCCLIKDLGNHTLFDLLSASRATAKQNTGHHAGVIDESVLSYYYQALNWLPRFQVEAPRFIDFTLGYPRHAFDRLSMQWDLNYFKYYYLKLVGIPFQEQELKGDYQKLISWLSQAPSDYCLYRDFQSRNIMIFQKQPWFIDYQGGRKGALPYDVASLLYDAKANLSENVREALLNHYLEVLETLLPGSRKPFLDSYPGFILIRILQAMGAYGYRGLYERKSHFLQSIPFALANLRNLLDTWDAVPGLFQLPVLKDVLNRVVNSPESKQGNSSSQESTLTVAIHSFSYKNCIPEDPSGHGGGFVFDCRGLPNPGREERFKSLSGLDQPVRDYLEKAGEVEVFLNHVFALVDQTVRNYRERSFQNLQVSFGCTGGQHRSVFCADKLRLHLQNEPITIKISHENMDAWQ